VMREPARQLERLRKAGSTPTRGGSGPLTRAWPPKHCWAKASARAGSLAGRLMVKRLPSGVVFGRLQDGHGRISSCEPAICWGEESSTGSRTSDRRSHRREGTDLQDPAREITLEVQSFQLLTKSLRPLTREVARAEGCRDSISPAICRPHRNPAVRDVFRARTRSSPPMRGYSTNAISSMSTHRCCQEVPAVARAALCHPSQLARPRPVPPDCAGATPEAVAGWGFERVYEVGGCFATRSVTATQPDHAARVLPGLRRTTTT